MKTYEKGRWCLAIGMVCALCSCNTSAGKVQKFLAMGNADYEKEDHVKAQERADLVLRKEPDNQQALGLLGGILLSEHKPRPARELLEKLLPRSEKEIDFHLLLASAYSRLEDSASAESLLRQGVAQNPSSIPLRIGIANFYLEQKKPEKVEAVLKQIMAMEPGKAEHVERLASFFWHEGRKTEAENLLQGLLEKPRDAEAEMQKAVDLLPEDPAANLELADFYRANGDRDKAGRKRT